MENLLVRALIFINRWSYVFYIVGGLGIIVYLRRARKAFHQRRYTPFPIEREEASATLRDGLIIIIIIIAILATTFYIDRILLVDPSPATGADQSLFSPSFFAIPTSPAIPSTSLFTPTLSEGEEAVEKSENLEEAEAPPSIEASDVPPATCDIADVQISAPANAESVSGNVAIMGTANIDDFQFYKIEYGQGANPEFFTILGETVLEPVDNGLLMNWATDTLTSDIWTLRLTVVDQSGYFSSPCEIHVVIS